jgi:hypothetical protein
MILTVQLSSTAQQHINRMIYFNHTMTFQPTIDINRTLKFGFRVIV